VGKKVPIVCSEAVGRIGVVTIESVWIDEVESCPFPVEVETDDSSIVDSKSVEWMLEQSAQPTEEIGTIDEDVKLGAVGKSLIEVTLLDSADANDEIPVSVVQCTAGIVDVIVVVTTEVMRRVFETTERHASAAA
jgi:hypothetical protein